MTGSDFFPYFWLGTVVLMGAVSLVWGVYELHRGEVRWGSSGAKYGREEEPFYFWMTVLGRFAGVVVAGFFFWFGLDMLR